MRAELRAGIEALPAILTQNYTQGKINPSKTVKSKSGNQFLIGEASSKFFSLVLPLLIPSLLWLMINSKKLGWKPITQFSWLYPCSFGCRRFRRQRQCQWWQLLFVSQTLPLMHIMSRSQIYRRQPQDAAFGYGVRRSFLCQRNEQKLTQNVDAAATADTCGNQTKSPFIHWLTWSPDSHYKLVAQWYVSKY